MKTHLQKQHQIAVSDGNDLKPKPSNGAFNQNPGHEITFGAWNGQDHHFNRLRVNAPVIQAKLSVSQPDDKYEQEADATADRIIRMENIQANRSKYQSIPVIQRKCAECEEEEKQVQRKPLSSGITPVGENSASGFELSSSLNNKINSRQGSGQRMDKQTQSFMSGRFGFDFSKVKIHTDNEASSLNKELNAKAFTTGKDIYFNDRNYNPASNEGKRLLAHELTHVVQQSGSVHSPESTMIRRTPLDDAKAVSKKVHDAISGAKVNEADVLSALGTLGRDPAKVTLLKTTYKTENKTELVADLTKDMSGANLSRALFLLNAPPADTTAVAEVTVDKAGTKDFEKEVGGGKVAVNTGVDFKTLDGTAYPGGFSVGFTGAKSSETRYIQTLWSEIISTQPDKSETWVNKTGLGSANGNPMDLTTDPAKPKYKIDSASTSSPFYESGGINIRKASGNVNYDRPSEYHDIIKKQFEAGATKVVERDHFDNFLIQEEKVLYQVSLYVEWVYTSKTTMTRTTKFGSGAAISSLPAEVRKQLLKEYPAFDYIS